MKKVLQISGGSIRGIIPLVVLKKIEKDSGKRCCEIFDMMSGASTGSIICGMLASGVPADIIYDIYVKECKELFKKNSFLSRFFKGKRKYDRSHLLRRINDFIAKYGEGPHMRDTRTDFLSAAFNEVTGRTHFQKSWDDAHKDLLLANVIAWSALSATHYFGPINVPSYTYIRTYQLEKPKKEAGATFNDGGIGRNNDTLMESLAVCMQRGWHRKEEVHVLSLGCGATRLYTPYSKTSRMGKVKRIMRYKSLDQLESAYDQLQRAEKLRDGEPNLNFTRHDSVLSGKEAAFDDFGMIPNYITCGTELLDDIPEIYLK
jgi:patatin-like phospholipase/acyl hydrolase